MASTLPSFGDCCTPCEDPVTVSVPGPQGAAGADGADGADGTDSYTLTTAEFIMPAVGATVAVSVGDSRGFIVGQFVPVQFAGTMVVSAKPDQTHLTLENSAAATGNVVAGTAIPVDSIVGPPIGSTVQGSVYNATTMTWYRLTMTGAVGEEVLAWEPL